MIDHGITCLQMLCELSGPAPAFALVPTQPFPAICELIVHYTPRNHLEFRTPSLSHACTGFDELISRVLATDAALCEELVRQREPTSQLLMVWI